MFDYEDISVKDAFRKVQNSMASKAGTGSLSAVAKDS